MGTTSSTATAHKNEFDRILRDAKRCTGSAAVVVALTPLLDIPMTEADATGWVSLAQLREWRHCRTALFAAGLHVCIKEIVCFAIDRGPTGSVNGTARHSKDSLKPKAIARVTTALLLLRRWMPVALESGDVPLPSCQSPTSRSVTVSPFPAGAANAAAAPAAPSATNAAAPTSPVVRSSSYSSSLQKTAATYQFQQLFFAEGRTCEDELPEGRFSPFTPPSSLLLHSYGSVLVWALVECCFIEGFSLAKLHFRPSATASMAHPEVTTEGWLWYRGLGADDPYTSPTGLKTDATALQMRVLLLSTLVSVVASPVFHPRFQQQQDSTRQSPSASFSDPSAGASATPTPASPPPPRKSSSGALPSPDSLASDSQPLSPPSPPVAYRDTIFMECLLSTVSVPLMPTLTLSMLNAVLQYVPYGSLPYTSYYASEDGESEVTWSLRFLLVVLDAKGAPLHQPAPSYVSPTSRRGPGDIRRAADYAGKASVEQRKVRAPPPLYVNSVRRMIAELTLTEARYVLDRLHTLISLRTYASQTYLPDSQKTIDVQDELMLLLWKLVDSSPMVLTQFSFHTAALSYVVPLVGYAMDVKQDPKQYIHRLQLSMFLMLRFSQLRGFCLQCVRPFTETVPFPFPRLPSSGVSYFDFLLIAFSSLLELVKDTSLVSPLTSCSTVLVNFAPYVNAISPLASLKLTYAFGVVSARLLRVRAIAAAAAAPGSPASPGSPNNISPGSLPLVRHSLEEMVINLCETMASLLQYNGLKPLLAALVRHRSVIRTLATTQMPPGHNPFYITTLTTAVVQAEPLVSSAFANDSTSGGGMGDASIASQNSAARTTTTVSYNALQEAQVREVSLAVEGLQGLTLVGLLPTPHPIVVRKVNTTVYVEEWVTVTLWTCLYLKLPSEALGDELSARLLKF